VPGTLVEKHVVGEQDVFYNTSYFISSAGTILASYTKKNLWHPERAYLTSSAHSPHTAFDTPLGRVGLLTCWDLAFPEAFRDLIADGAKMIIIPSFWTLADCGPEARKLNPNAERMFLDSVLAARAFENTAAVVYVNAGGPVGEPGDWAGLSQVTMPIMGKLGGLGAEEGLEVVDLDMQVLELAEGIYKVREDMGREEWHYGYSLRKNNGVSREGREK
jgi:predicted amidohydrolase